MKPTLKAAVLDALNEMKAINIKALDVGDITSITDYMIIATGNSSRHVQAIKDAVLEETKKYDYEPIGIEGESVAEWILIDLGDVVVHVMQPATREFYQLEKLWTPFEVTVAVA